MFSFRSGNLWILLDRVYDGELEAKLRHWRAAKVPNTVVSRLIFTDIGVWVSKETIRKWYIQMDAEDAEDGGSAA